jgi:hypothetical protein
MKILDYYFIKEFQWKSNWFSETGLLKAKIYPTNEFIQNNKYIDYDIIGGVFLYNKEFKSIDLTNLIIQNIQRVISKELNSYTISNEIMSLEIESFFTKPIDNLGDSEGIEAPLSWNVSTPKEFQYIPSIEILKLFEDWKIFLEMQKNISL